MRIIIATWSRQLVLEVGLQEPILEIKRKIEQTLGVPVASQTLAVSGWELIDGLDMEDYPIVNEGTKIDLTIKCNIQPPLINNCSKIPVIIKFSARQIIIEVDRTDTVRSLKEKIHIVDGTPVKTMLLYFSGREMEEDFRNLSEYGICDFSEIIVFLKNMNRQRDVPTINWLSIVVQTSSSLLNAASIPVEIEDSKTVNDLRQLLLSRKILPLDDYLFIHKQRIMRDSCSLMSHGVENGDSLYVFKGTVSRNGY